MGLYEQDFPGEYEIIVVDNGSKDGTGDVVRKEFPQVRVVEEPRKGTNSARERGRLAASADILAFLDADTVPTRHWLQNGLRYFNDPSVVAVTGSYNFYDGGSFLQFGARFVSEIAYPAALWFTREIMGMGIMVGGNCFIRASTLRDIGGFNTDIECLGDDTDTAIRLSEVGRIVYRKDVFAMTSARTYYRDGVLKTLWGYTFHAARISARARRNRKPVLHTTTRS